MKPKFADKQQLLYRKYYAQCCAKGGVAAKLSGWVRTLHFFTVSIDDSKYIEQTTIFKLQQLFHELNTEVTTLIQFINIFDKVYHLTILAQDHNQDQSCLQLTFARSRNNSIEVKFCTVQILPLYNQVMNGQ